MSIFKRLYNIARANIGKHIPAGKRHGPDTRQQETRSSSYREEHTYRGERDDETRGNTRAQPGQDRVLAQYYANLEVPYGSDLKTVRKAWKDLLRKYHPDLHSNDAKKKDVARQLTQELNHAYGELEKHLKRQAR